MTSRLFLILAVILSLAADPAWAQQAPAPSHETIAVAGRQVEVSIWPAQGEERAVIVFSHGLGGEPAAYERILEAWTEAGFTVLAPTHPDSHANPDRAAFNGAPGFFARIADMAAVREMARARSPGRPLIAAGHSYGALMSAMSGGAVTAAGPQRDPDVDAAILLSSTGSIPGLMPPNTFAGLAVPTITITGDQDIVPSYADDPAVHRAAFEQAAGEGHMILTFAGGDHGFVRNAGPEDFALMAVATIDFIRARVLGDADAQTRLDALAAQGVTVERR